MPEGYKCPLCGVDGSKFIEMKEGAALAAEHVFGVGMNLDAIHDTVHEMARDEARHGKAFAGLLERYFGK